ncbi:MAG: efflux RND transporter permease subunit [Rhodospirillales bacterium]|nr:efflux RND transporter permease subunit [Acetobacter sp.]
MAETQPQDEPEPSSPRVDRDTPDAAHAVQQDRQDPAGKGPHQAEGGKTLTGKLVQFSGGLSAPFITRPVMTVLLSLAVVAFGFFTYKLLAVNDLPAVDYPVINVSVSYPGASPETMANNIATPLEKQFLLIDGLELITSASTQSNTSLTLQFNLSKSLDAAATDVQAAIQRATGQLPTDLPSPPTFTKTNPNDQAILLLGLVTDTMTDADLYKYANTVVAQQISIIEGVSQVQVYGVQGAMRIKADPGALVNRGMTMADLATGITAGTAYSGAGQLDGTHRTFVVQPHGQLDSVDGYKNLIVARNQDQSPVFLKDVAKVYYGLQDERQSREFWVRDLNHQPGSTVVLAVSRLPGSNAVQVVRAIQKVLPSLKAGLPGSIKLLQVYDRSRTIVDSVHDVQTTLFIAFVLVVVVIFVFLGRAADTLIPAVALPLSLLLTFVAMYLLNYSINNLTLMALTLAIGFLVDDAVVFLENVVRRAEAGETIYQATLNSAGEISFTILSMTLSLAAVFIPLVFLPSLLGRIFREFSVTIIVAIFASGLVSLTLTPMMCSRVLSERGKGSKQTWVERNVGRLLAWVVGWYGRTLDWFLNYSWITAFLYVACLVGVFVFFKLLPFTLLPTGDSGFIRGVFIAQEGSSPEQMRRYQSHVNELLKADPAVSQFFTIAGLSGRAASSQGLAFVFLKDAKERPPMDAVVARLQQKLATIPGIVVIMNPSPVLQINIGATNQTQGRYAYTLSGINPDEVYAAAAKLLGKMHQYPGFSTVRSDYYNHTPNLDINIDRDRASLYGVGAAKIEALLRAAYSENYVYLIKQSDNQYQVILEADDQTRAHPEDPGNLYVKADDNRTLVPMRAVTTSKETLGLQAVNHYNQFTSVTINYNLQPGAADSEASRFITDSVKQILAETPAVQGTFQGEALVLQQLINALVPLVIGAVFVMYIILGILYESYIHPVTVLSTLPPAIVGGLGTLWLFNSTLSLYSIIGLFLLMGIVKKNGIMIVDFALQRLDEGLDRRAAIHEASVERFRPIMMTTLAALMGAVPLALGYGADGSSRQPLGMVIVGGLLVSQLITLYVTPVIYLWLEWVQENVFDRVPFLRSSHTHHEDDDSPAKDGGREASAPHPTA